MKKNYRLIFILSLIFALFLTSCDFDFEDDVQEEISTEYTFFAYNPDSTANPANGSITYEIGTQLSAASMPSFLEGGVNTLKPGYLIDSWKYLKNPDTGKEYPAGIVLDSDGNVTSLTVQAARSYFYVSSWSPMTYYLHFDANGGYGSMSDMTMTYDTSYTLDANTFARNGFDFKGWGWNAGDTNVAFPDGVTGVTNLTRVTGGTVTLYAIWWKKNITISFDANGGSGTMSPIAAEVNVTKVPGCTFTAPTGYDFYAWKSTKTGYLYYETDTLTESKWPNNDDIFIAQWTPKPYTLTLNGNGGTINGATSITGKCLYNTATRISTFYYNCSRTGYNFTKWNTAADGSGTAYSIDDSITLTADQTLYAQWTPQTITIKYNANGGTGTMASSSTLTYGTTYTLTENAFTRAGYKFSGWATSSNSSTVTFSDKAVINTSNWDSLYYYPSNGNLYAVWKEKFSLGSPTTSTASVSKGTLGDTSVTLTTSTSATTYIWSIDGTQVSTSNTCTIPYSSYSTGSHNIVLVCISISASDATVTKYVNTFTIN